MHVCLCLNVCKGEKRGGGRGRGGAHTRNQTCMTVKERTCQCMKVLTAEDACARTCV